MLATSKELKHRTGSLIQSDALNAFDSRFKPYLGPV